MKKLMMLAVAMGAAVAFADYGYLYWKVDQSAAENPIEFSYAQIKAENGGAAEYLNPALGITGGGTGLAAGPVNQELTKDYSGYNFVVELLDSNFGVIGESGTFAFSDLTQFVFTGKEQSGATPWTVSAFTVPEPTSGLLLLLGLAGLALKRKKENANA